MGRSTLTNLPFFLGPFLEAVVDFFQRRTGWSSRISAQFQSHRIPFLIASSEDDRIWRSCRNIPRDAWGSRRCWVNGERHHLQNQPLCCINRIVRSKGRKRTNNRLTNRDTKVYIQNESAYPEYTFCKCDGRNRASSARLWTKTMSKCIKFLFICNVEKWSKLKSMKYKLGNLNHNNEN